MSREEQEPEMDGEWETHPAFGAIRIGRVSGGSSSLFDSEIKHQHYVVLRVYTAKRKRDLNRDWIHEGRQVVEVAMTESQWATAISSLNSSATPVTLQWTQEGGSLPGIPFAPRMEISQAETRRAAHRMFEDVRAALAEYKAHKTAANLKTLESVLGNSAVNVEYAATSLTEHAEKVTQKAKADIEAMIDHRARVLGIDPVTMTKEIES